MDVINWAKFPPRDFRGIKVLHQSRSLTYECSLGICEVSWRVDAPQMKLEREREALVGWSWSAVAALSSLRVFCFCLYTDKHPVGVSETCQCVCVCVGPLQRNSVVVGVTTQTNLGAGCGIYHLCTTHSWMRQIKMFLLWSCQTVWFSSCPHNVMKWLSYFRRWRGDCPTNHPFILISCTYLFCFTVII